jgi:hypothetical protein
MRYLLSLYIAFAFLPLTATANDDSDLNYTGLDHIFESLDQFIIENPGATESETNEFVQAIIANDRILRNGDGSDFDYGEIIDGIIQFADPRSKLTQAEKDLFSENPFKGLLSLKQAVKAKPASIEIYADDNLLNGNGDAFRHCYWSALMTANIDLQWARRWGEAHEKVPNPIMLETVMDNQNNADGRMYASRNPSAGDDGLKFACIWLVDNGRLSRISSSSRIIRTDGTGRR